MTSSIMVKAPEACRLLGISRMTMYRLEVRGVLRFGRIDPDNNKSHKLYSVEHLQEVARKLQQQRA